MTPADKLRELLATRPAMPTTTELVRWWRDGGRFVDELLRCLSDAAPGPQHDGLFCDVRATVERLRSDLEALDLDLVAARAALRREQDARAELRVELERAKAERAVTIAPGDVASAAMAAGEEIARIRSERDEHHQMLRDVVDLCIQGGDLPRIRTLLGPDAPLRAVRKLVDQLNEARARIATMEPIVDSMRAAVTAPTGREEAANIRKAGRLTRESLPAVIAATDEQPPPAVDDETRCAVCGWPLAERVDQGCVRGNCSHRPRPANLYAPERAKREADELHARAIANGMPPSGRFA